MIGAAEAVTFLRDKPVGIIRGAGAALQARLAKDGITHIGQIQDADQRDLARRYGNTGLWLHRLAHARGHAHRRSVRRDEEHLVGNDLRREHLATSTSSRASSGGRPSASRRAPRRSDLGGRTVVLKLKTADFKIRTRSVSLDAPTQLADRIFRVAREALRARPTAPPIACSASASATSAPASDCDPDDLVDDGAGKRAAAERAMDKVRAKFGGEAVGKGRSARRRRER